METFYRRKIAINHPKIKKNDYGLSQSIVIIRKNPMNTIETSINAIRDNVFQMPFFEISVKIQDNIYERNIIWYK